MRRRYAKSFLVFALAGMATTLAVAWMLAVVVDVRRGPMTQSDRYVNDERWTLQRWDREGAAQIQSTRARGLNWSPQQAAGVPDTPTPGDHVTAWASQSPDGGVEWLVLEYADAVVASAVEVYESHAPGALFKVAAVDDTGNETVAWTGTDPSRVSPSATPGGVAIATIPITLKTPTRRVKIYLDSAKVPSWNEIDAVALIDQRGARRWARKVEASSTYATGGGGTSSSGADAARLAPAWARLDRPGADFETGASNSEDRTVDARGWPLLALHSAVATSSSAVSTTGGRLAPTGANSLTLSGFTFTGTVAVTTPATPGPRPPLPMRPIWVGLAVNTVFFGICWLVIWTALTVPRRFVRDLARLRHGACVACGYDLGFDFIRGCPECGWRRSDRVTAGASPPPGSPPPGRG